MHEFKDIKIAVAGTSYVDLNIVILCIEELRLNV